MSVDEHNRPMVRSEITVQVIGEEVMLYDSVGEKIHVLNHSAYAIWKLCNGENTLEDMRKTLSAQYPDASSEVADDIQASIDVFRQKMLLV